MGAADGAGGQDESLPDERLAALAVLGAPAALAALAVLGALAAPAGCCGNPSAMTRFSGTARMSGTRLNQGRDRRPVHAA